MAEILDLFAPLADAAPEPRATATDYRITDSDRLGGASKGARIWHNLEAIRIAKELAAAKRTASLSEQRALVHYSGWGGLSDVFRASARQRQERQAGEQLRGLLTEAEYKAARDTILSAYYTPPEVVRALYRMVEHFGFRGGKVLEPGSGIGHFIGLAPAGLSMHWNACEIDPVSAQIAAALYPCASVENCGFQDSGARFGHFDLVVMNPPYGEQTITDNAAGREAISGLRIHNYFVARAIHHLRPGGVLAMVVTRRFMDATDAQCARAVGGLANFLGAIRLPSATFADFADTEVVTDLVFFQRRHEASEQSNWPTELVGVSVDGGGEHRINRWFAEHPELVLGSFGEAKGYLGRLDLTVKAAEGYTLSEAAAEAMGGAVFGPLADCLHAGDDTRAPEPMDAEPAPAPLTITRDDVPSFGYFREGEVIYQRMDDDEFGNPQWRTLDAETQWTEKATLGARRLARISGLLDLRDAGFNLIDLERADRPAHEIEGARAALNRLYDRFVKRFGRVNDPANFSLVRHDPRIECGLEVNYKRAVTPAVARRTGAKPGPSRADKAALLQSRVFRPMSKPQTADNIKDACAYSLQEHATISVPRVAQLLGLSESDAQAQLLKDGYLFECPQTGALIDRDAYLSGNVRAKRKACGSDPRFAANAAALDAVMPAYVPAEDIFASFGALWIPASVYEAFADAIGIKGARLSYSRALGVVRVVEKSSIEQNAVNLPWKNDDYDIDQIFNALSAKKPLIAYDHTEDRHGNRIRVVNTTRTKTLRGIEPAFLTFFNTWLWADPDRAELLAEAYNNELNTNAGRHFDSAMLQPVGASPDVILRESQRAAAWRMIVSPVTLLDHIVGAGKTFTLITGIMERRRLGVSKRPMMVVPNHLIGQWAASFYQLYPAAQLLVANEQDFTRANRRRLLARMATSDVDCILIGHSSLAFIGLEPETVEAFEQEELEHIELALSEALHAEDRASTRVLIGRKKKLEESMKRAAKVPRDPGVSWEQLGVDFLGVDEIHKYKNLAYTSTMRGVVGMGNPEGAKKAWDLYAKVQEMLARGAAFASATGTPISNSAVEMYSLLRVHNRQALRERGIETFDAWAKTYASIESRIEYTATGGVKERTVFASFNNLPELNQIYHAFSDVVLMDDLQRLHAEQMHALNAADGGSRRRSFPVPKVAEGGRVLDAAEPNDAQVQFMDYLVVRSKACEHNSADADYRRIDNALWITNDARKMALDIRLVDPFGQDHPDNKVSRCARRVLDFAKRWEAERGTQLVFCDLSTPTGGAGAKARKMLRDALAVVVSPERWKLHGKNLSGHWRLIAQWLEEQAEDEQAKQLDSARARKFLDNHAVDVAAACLTADVGFSVYDDLKEKLVAGGLAPHEVRFIHEANTSAQREELFELVREGVVRVLVGSTPKMGEGMNVQDRLVAIHHLDAPWRPSDVEQREGRGVRQGNLLYAADPDGFELAIVAYSTTRTFDAVMWQILARKAAMIIQFRSGARSIEEGDDDAKSYSEFMAVSTGNPAFRRKFELEREIDLLNGERSRIDAQRASAQRIVSGADARRAEAEKHVQRALAAQAAVDGPLVAELEGARYACDDWRQVWETARAAGKASGRKVTMLSREVTEASAWASFGQGITARIERGAKTVGFALNGVRAVIEVWSEMAGKASYRMRLDGFTVWDTTARVRFPVGEFLDVLDSSVRMTRMSEAVDGARDYFGSVCKRIEDCETLLREMRFDGTERLEAATEELDEVVATVNVIETEVAAKRLANRNAYVEADYIRSRYLREVMEDEARRCAA